MAEKLNPGSIRGSFWPGPIEVKLVEGTGEHIRIVGVTTISREPGEVA